MKDFFRQFCVSFIQSSLTYSQGLNTIVFLPYVTGLITVFTLEVNFTLTFFFFFKLNRVYFKSACRNNSVHIFLAYLICIVIKDETELMTSCISSLWWLVLQLKRGNCHSVVMLHALFLLRMLIFFLEIYPNR